MLIVARDNGVIDVNYYERCNTRIVQVTFGRGLPCGMQPISTESPSVKIKFVAVIKLTVGGSKNTIMNDGNE